MKIPVVKTTPYVATKRTMMRLNDRINSTLIWAGILSLPVIACKTGLDTNQRRVDLELLRVVPVADSMDSSRAEITLRLKNLDERNIEAKSIRYRIEGNDLRQAVQGEQPWTVRIEPLSQAEAKVEALVEFPEDPEKFKRVLESRELPVNVSGEVLLATGQKISFQEEAMLTTPSFPKFVVYRAQAARYGDERLDVTMYLRLVNENLFPISIDSVEYEIWIEGKKIRDETAAVGSKLFQGAQEEYEVGAEVSPKSFDAKRVKHLVKTGKLQYKVQGKLNTHQLELPFTYEGELEVGGTR